MATYYTLYQKQKTESSWELVSSFDDIMSAKEFLFDCRTEDKLLRIYNCEYKIEENTD